MCFTNCNTFTGICGSEIMNSFSYAAHYCLLIVTVTGIATLFLSAGAGDGVGVNI